jgi:hypothetical protein
MVQQAAFWTFGVVWLGVGGFLFMRSRLLQNAYLRGFKHELDFALGDPFFVAGSVRTSRRIYSLMHDLQPNAELERTRREIWRRLRYYLTWIFGFPVICIAVAAFLIATGLVRLT